MIEPSHISVRSWGQWSLGDDNINYIDHLGRFQSMVCISELEVVVDAASTEGPKSARSSKDPPNFGRFWHTNQAQLSHEDEHWLPIYAVIIGSPTYGVCA